MFDLEEMHRSQAELYDKEGMKALCEASCTKAHLSTDISQQLASVVTMYDILFLCEVDSTLTLFCIHRKASSYEYIHTGNAPFVLAEGSIVWSDPIKVQCKEKR